jgi:hypothetical protein
MKTMRLFCYSRVAIGMCGGDYFAVTTGHLTISGDGLSQPARRDLTCIKGIEGC